MQHECTQRSERMALAKEATGAYVRVVRVELPLELGLMFVELFDFVVCELRQNSNNKTVGGGEQPRRKARAYFEFEFEVLEVLFELQRGMSQSPPPHTHPSTHPLRLLSGSFAVSGYSSQARILTVSAPLIWVLTEQCSLARIIAATHLVLLVLHLDDLSPTANHTTSELGSKQRPFTALAFAQELAREEEKKAPRYAAAYDLSSRDSERRLHTNSANDNGANEKFGRTARCCEVRFHVFEFALGRYAVAKLVHSTAGSRKEKLNGRRGCAYCGAWRPPS